MIMSSSVLIRSMVLLSACCSICSACSAHEAMDDNPFTAHDACIAKFDSRFDGQFDSIPASIVGDALIEKILDYLPSQEHRIVTAASNSAVSFVGRRLTTEDYDVINENLNRFKVDGFDRENVCDLDYPFVNAEYMLDRLNLELTEAGIDTKRAFSPPGQELFGSELQDAMLTRLIIFASQTKGGGGN